MENFKNKMPQMNYRLNFQRILFVGTGTIYTSVLKYKMQYIEIIANVINDQ